MQTFDDKVDAAVHAALMTLGLSVNTRMDLAIRLNDFITREFQFAVTDDDEERDADSSRSPTSAEGVGDD
ncbi:hypothetical protein [Pseudogemmobacter humi]|uniref:Uncharacterized protein n=1 Tax=Pseudogemmobacter humi TaxID=2483812 RepID=A0A3P5XSP0_9RHOB|nr:hypothetical protein [Pseudogemmobacter humi]VDC33824.1 hypothetical protein XINFAN_04053 [Pseudogemmobacter humi]